MTIGVVYNTRGRCETYLLAGRAVMGALTISLKHCACVLDIIGVCKSYEEATKITVKSNNREVSKRNIYLMDMSGKVVSATLWGEDVSTWTEQPEHVQKRGDLSWELWNLAHINPS